MKNTYKITVSDSDGIVFACTHVAEKYTTNQIPRDLLDALGQKYAPCAIVCKCVTEGWYAEKAYQGKGE